MNRILKSYLMPYLLRYITSVLLLVMIGVFYFFPQLDRSIFFLLIFALMLFSLGYFLFYHLYWKHRLLYQIASTSSCRLCDTVVEPGEEDFYSCHACGYQNQNETEPEVSTLLEHFQDFKFCKQYFEAAILSCQDILLNAGLVKDERQNEDLKDVLDHLTSGQRLLQDKIEHHTELLEIPGVTEEIETLFYTDYWAENAMLDLGITEMARKLTEELQRMLQAVDLILEQYRSSILHEMMMLE